MRTPATVQADSEIGTEFRRARMPSTADTYRNAAKEHLLRAQDSFDDEEYFLAHYLFG